MLYSKDIVNSFKTDLEDFFNNEINYSMGNYFYNLRYKYNIPYTFNNKYNILTLIFDDKVISINLNNFKRKIKLKTILNN